MNQKVEVKGITLTPEEVAASPANPQAVVCFAPPDDGHSWQPWLKDRGAYDRVVSVPQELEDGCWSLSMGHPAEKRSSVTVASLVGMPTGPPDPDGSSVKPKTIRGPWTFEFGAPYASK